jgi:hypothetical protein
MQRHLPMLISCKEPQGRDATKLNARYKQGGDTPQTIIPETSKIPTPDMFLGVVATVNVSTRQGYPNMSDECIGCGNRHFPSHGGSVIILSIHVDEEGQLPSLVSLGRNGLASGEAVRALHFHSLCTMGADAQSSTR